MHNLIEKLVAFDDNIESIYLKGSRQQNEITDYWSDTDLLIVLKENVKLIELYSIWFDNHFKPVIAKQFYEYEGGIVYRIVSEKNKNIIQYDIQLVTNDFWKKNIGGMNKNMTCLYGTDETCSSFIAAVDTYKFTHNEDEINNIWFKYFECIKKIARKDNLIGLHLLLDLIRDYLVLEMMERDIKFGTNTHRFGKSEELPSALDMNSLKENKASDRLQFIKVLAKLFDEKLLEIHEQYISRYDYIEKHIEVSIKVLSENIK